MKHRMYSIPLMMMLLCTYGLLFKLNVNYLKWYHYGSAYVSSSFYMFGIINSKDTHSPSISGQSEFDRTENVTIEIPQRALPFSCFSCLPGWLDSIRDVLIYLKSNRYQIRFALQTILPVRATLSLNVRLWAELVG